MSKFVEAGKGEALASPTEGLVVPETATATSCSFLVVCRRVLLASLAAVLPVTSAASARAQSADASESAAADSGSNKDSEKTDLIEKKAAKTPDLPPSPPAPVAIPADPLPPLPAFNDFGEVGLLQTPSARMMPSGEIASGISYVDPYTRFFVSAQILPWLSGTFRYTSIANIAYNGFYTNTDYKDRSFDLKVRLLKEDDDQPDLSIGVRDIGGTGLFGSEYIVATRRWRDFDFTCGIAWGYIGDGGSISNPLTAISYFDKPRGNSQIGGVGESYFRGQTIGVFGGVQYNTSIDGLRLFAEYDAHDYKGERFGIPDVGEFPVNIGAQYAFDRNFTVTAGLERGNALMVRGSMQINTDKMTHAVPASPPPKPLVRDDVARSEVVSNAVQEPVTPFLSPASLQGTSGQVAVDRFFDGMERARIQPGDIIITGKTVTVALSALQTAPRNDALARAAYGLVSSGSLGNVDQISFLVVDHGLVLARQTLATSDLRRSVTLTGSPETLLAPSSHQWNKAMERLEQKPSLTEALTSALENIGVQPVAIAVRGREILLDLPVNTTVEPEKFARAALIVGTATRDIDQLVFLFPGNRGTVTRLAYATHGTVLPEGEDGSLLMTGTDGDAASPAWRKPFEVSSAKEKEIAQAIFRDLKEEGITGVAFKIEGRTALLEYQQRSSRNPAIPLGRASRIMARYVPPEIEKFTLIPEDGGMPVSRVSVMRADMEHMWMASASAEEVWQHTGFDKASSIEGGYANEKTYPSFSWGLNPRWRQHVGGGDNFYAWQLWAELSGTVNLSRTLRIGSSVGQNIYNTFDTLDNNPQSTLPHVRSEIVRYFQESNTWMNTLFVNYNDALFPDVYGRLTAGYLEEMFAGVSGEILYRPHNEPWAVSLELDRVQQRGYARDFSLNDYQVTTGGLTVYYNLPWYNIGTSLHVGQYLAGDRGGTLEIWREFEGGATLGAWVSKTNVSSADFGEGSFDKGIRLSVPLDMLTGKSTRTTLGMAFSPLTRDGAQQLSVPTRLYPMVTGQGDDRMGNGWSDLNK